MPSRINDAIKSIQSDLMCFAQELVRIRSYTGDESSVAVFVKDKMEQLGYDDVHMDSMGNVLGTLGNGNGPGILLDSHMDTVPVEDECQWNYPPFGGILKDGTLYGRGAADMKCGLAAAIYAGHVVKSLGLANGKRIYITATVMEEDYDGVALLHLIRQNKLNLSAAVMCEPSDMKIGIGHSGRALIQIETHGKSAHASHPELGENAIYSAARIAERVMQLNDNIAGSTAVTSMHSKETSNNSIPASAIMLIDRRLRVHEDEAFLRSEMDAMTEGCNADWLICDVRGKTWTGSNIVLHSFLPAWEISKTHPLVQTACDALQDMTAQAPQIVTFGFSTNATATAALLNIPTLILGPGKTEEAHMPNEKCKIDQMMDACKAYAYLCANYVESAQTQS